MNALVSMHGIWLLVFAPAAAVVAWRYSGVAVRKIALYASILTAVGLVGWFVYLAAVGAEFSGSVYDRVMHAFGTIFIESTSFPIVQLILALLIVVLWPRKFEFRKSASVAPVLATDQTSVGL